MSDKTTASQFDPIVPIRGDIEAWRQHFAAVGWNTKRKAKSYQLDGVRITTPGFISVLVSRAEIEAAGVEIPSTGVIDHRW